MQEPPDPDALHWRRSTYPMVIVAALAALAVVGSLGWSLLGPSPPRPVRFEGVADGDPSCHGPDLWTGEAAYTACDWDYRHHALVRFEPLTARAAVIHRWERDDGNVPRLRFATRCGEGRLFAIGQTDAVRLLRVEGERVSAREVDLAPLDLLGVTCGAGGAGLFVRRRDGGYAVVRAEREGPAETERRIGRDDVPGRIAGAWFEDGQWRALVRTRGGDLLVGPLGGSFDRVGGPAPRDVCLLGEPSGQVACLAPDVVVTRAAQGRSAQGLRAIALPERADITAVAIAEGSSRAGWATGRLGAADGARFGGLGEEDLRLTERADHVLARRGDGPAVPVTTSASLLRLGARALPLPDGRTAVWGRLGASVIVLGPDLEREDPLDPVARVVRAARGSTYRGVSFAAALVLTVLWLALGIAVVRRRPRLRVEPRLRLLTVVYLLALLACADGFHEALQRI